MTLPMVHVLTITIMKTYAQDYFSTQIESSVEFLNIWKNSNFIYFL